MPCGKLLNTSLFNKMVGFGTIGPILVPTPSTLGASPVASIDRKVPVILPAKHVDGDVAAYFLS